MKDIKFRAYDKQSNEMIYLEPSSTYDNGLWFKSDKHIDSEDIVIMQYTGLKDTTQFNELTKEEQKDWLKDNKIEDWKGKEIFEGHIVEIEFDEDYRQIGEVVFECFGFSVNLVDTRSIPISYIYGHDFNLKILGDIYQNPELLEINK